MFDINFYRQFANNENLIVSMMRQNPDAAFHLLESYRSPSPVIYNIETTNRCNMQCKMCPRTNLMTRKVEDIDPLTFEKVVQQIEPHSKDSWNKWVEFCENKYGIFQSDPPSENHFFLYIISRVIQLHGYGEPVLDKNISKYVEMLTKKGIPTYFSINPININYEQVISLMKNGLTYLKFCFDSIDDASSKEIRGSVSDFTLSYQRVKRVLELKKQNGLKTVIVITMINLAKQNQEQEYAKLKKLFSKEDVYLYLKSEDSQWYRKKYHGTQAIHGSEICKHPWMTMTIKSNGEAAMCMEDYNNEIILGDANSSSLNDIWNGKAYRSFRLSHILGNNDKCCNRCDLPVLGNVLETSAREE